MLTTTIRSKNIAIMFPSFMNLKRIQGPSHSLYLKILSGQGLENKIQIVSNYMRLPFYWQGLKARRWSISNRHHQMKDKTFA